MLPIEKTAHLVVPKVLGCKSTCKMERGWSLRMSNVTVNVNEVSSRAAVSVGTLDGIKCSLCSSGDRKRKKRYTTF